MLLDRYSPKPHHYAMPKVGHISPVKCTPSPVPSQTPPPLRSLFRLVKAHTKLLILHIRIWQWATEMEITVRYGYAASWLRGTVVERRSLTGKLSLSCARPAADRQPGRLSLSSFRGRQMSSRLQLDVRNLSLGMRHLVNAYEVEAGTV